MNKFKNFFEKIYNELVLLTIIFLFFLQTINTFFTGVYALNFAIMGIGPYVSLVIFLLSPFILLFFKKEFPVVGLIVTAGLLIIARILSLFIFDIVAISFITGVGVAAFFIFLPGYIIRKGEQEIKSLFLTITQAFSLALGLSIALKAIGSSFDFSTFGFGIIIFGVLLLILLLMFPGMYFTQKIEIEPIEETDETEIEEIEDAKPKFGKIFLLAMGVYGVIAIVWYALGFPTAFSRWSNASSLILTIVTVVSIIIFLVLITFIPYYFEKLKIWTVIILNLILSGCILVVAALPQAEYTVIQQIFTYLAAAFSPIALLDFLLLIKELRDAKASARQLGGAFGISSALFLIVSFLMVSSFNYEWVPGMTILRDRFYLVILLALLLFLIPMIFIKGIKGFNKNILKNIPRRLDLKNQIIVTSIIVLFIAGTGIGLGINLRNPVYSASPTELTIMTYNIHEGEDKYGELNYLRVLETLRKTSPDIIGLQESEMGRICFGNNDIVRFLAEKMNMFIHYGPNTVAGTYGVATLSKYPIISGETYFLPSEGHSQRVIIKTDIQVGAEVITVFNAHLGIEVDERLPQAEYIEDNFIPSATRTFFIGDYNTKDTETPYAYFVPALLDGWLEINPSGVNGTGFNGDTNRFPRRRIDYLFYTPDFTIVDIEVLTWANESDHWPVFGTFDL